MSENIGQPVVVDNRPGAGMILSATAALQSAADGYTMILAGNGTAISASLFKSLPYNILRDFTQVSTPATFDLVIVTTPKSKPNSVADLIATARQNPGKLNNSIGAEPYPSTPEETRARMTKEIKRWGAVIERANIPRK